MGRSAVEALGYSRDQSDRMIEAFAAMDRKGMLIAAEHYDPTIPAMENEAYLSVIRTNRDEMEAELEAQMKAIMREAKVS